jgi:hypothetical protein
MHVDQRFSIGYIPKYLLEPLHNRMRHNAENCMLATCIEGIKMFSQQGISFELISRLIAPNRAAGFGDEYV